MIEKKTHLLSLKIDGKELVIGTDNLKEVLELTGFVTQGQSGEVQKNGNGDEYRELVVEQKARIQGLQEQLMRLQMQESDNAALQSERIVAETRQPGGLRSQQPTNQEVGGREVSGQRQMLRNKLPEKSVLDVPVNEMTNEIWSKMSGEEQQQWQLRWMGK